MKTTITTLIILFIVSSCTNNTASHLKTYPKKTMLMDDGTEITIFVADNRERQIKGISNIKRRDFDIKHAILFPENKMIERQFWMPETHFNVDVIFMNKNFYVLDIHRNLQHYSKRKPRKSVPLSKKVNSQHVLEIRSDSPYARNIKIGDILRIE